VDRQLGELVDDHPKLELYLCADHGMNHKTRGIDPVRVLAEKGVRARAVAAIADKHKVHHGDLGGSVYVDLEKPADLPKAIEVLKAEPGIDEVLRRDEAARRFRLLASRTGDLFVLGQRDAALGALDVARREVNVRTHGSVHETRIPLLVYGRAAAKLETLVDLTASRAWEERT
jgi:phosphonoacetate hydrolase